MADMTPSGWINRPAVPVRSAGTDYMTKEENRAFSKVISFAIQRGKGKGRKKSSRRGSQRPAAKNVTAGKTQGLYK